MTREFQNHQMKMPTYTRRGFPSTRRHGVPRSVWINRERYPRWSAIRPGVSPSDYPRVDQRVLHGTVRRNQLPRSTASTLAMLYALRSVGRSSGSSGSVAIHPSSRHVATRRLRKGDRTGCSRRVMRPQACRSRMGHRVDHLPRYYKPYGSYDLRRAVKAGGYESGKEMEEGIRPMDLQSYWSDRLVSVSSSVSSGSGKGTDGKIRGQFNFPLGLITQYPALAEAYENYHALSSVSHRTRSVRWVGSSRLMTSPERVHRLSTAMYRMGFHWVPKTGTSRSR